MNYNLNFPPCKKCHSVTFYNLRQTFSCQLLSLISPGLENVDFLNVHLQPPASQTLAPSDQTEAKVVDILVVWCEEDIHIQLKWIEQIIEKCRPMPISGRDKNISSRAFILFLMTLIMTESLLSSSDCLILVFTRHDDQIENIDNFLALISSWLLTRHHILLSL